MAFSLTKCVIHLIKYKKLSYDSDSSDEDDEPTADKISDFITDQYMDLWKMMKKGDLIENIGKSGYRSEGRYYVDIDHKRKKSIIRNGLIIRDLHTEWDDYGSIPSHFYVITEFPKSYFNEDQIIVNNKYCPKQNKQSYWHCDNQPCFIDTTRLKLKNLTEDNIFMEESDDTRYVYVIVRFKKVNYCLINAIDIKHTNSNKDIIQPVISLFQKDIVCFENDENFVDEYMINVISKEHDIKEENFINFYC